MKIRFAQLYAAYAAFNKYAALIIAKTRAQSGGGSLPHQKDVAIIINSSAQPKAMVQDTTSENLATTNRNSPRFDYFKEINFFVEHQNEYCTEFVEYVFSVWARELPINTLSMAKTSVDENQI